MCLIWLDADLELKKRCRNTFQARSKKKRISRSNIEKFEDSEIDYNGNDD